MVKWAFVCIFSAGLFLMVGLYFLSLDFMYMYKFVFLEILGVELEYVVLCDWISCIFFSFVMVITCSVLFYSEDYMHGDVTLKRFYYLVLLFVGSMGLMIFSPNMISIMLGWDGLGVISYCLVVYYNSIRTYGSGFITFVTNRVGDIFLIFGIASMLMYGGWGFVFFEEWQSFNLLSLFIILGAFTKSAQFPFSSWLPAAMAAPTPVSSLVHSSTLVTAGVYILIRFSNIISMELYLFMGVVSMITMFVSGLCALMDMDLSSVVAFSTLSQLGIMMFILYSGNWVLCYMHMLIHALFSALMFLSGGVIIHGLNGQDFRFMGSMFGVSPILGAGFLVSGLSLGGAPFMSGFYSKDLCIEYIMYGGSNIFMDVMLLVCCFITIMYMYRLISGSLMEVYRGVCCLSHRETFFLKVGVVMLAVGGGFSGSVVMWNLLMNDFNFEVMFFDKLMLVALFPMGIVFGVSGLKFWYGREYIFFMFNSTYLSGDYVLGWLSFSERAAYHELGWSEMFGGTGVYMVILKYGSDFFFFSFVFFSYMLVLLLYVLFF